MTLKKILGILIPFELKHDLMSQKKNNKNKEVDVET